MNKDELNELDELIDILSQCRDGAEIQCRLLPNGGWVNKAHKDWRVTEFEYRIKSTRPRIGKLATPYQDYMWEGIELTDAVKEALEKAGIPYADK